MTLYRASATCPRDGVETNIACARCDDPICPQCLVYTPVGNKCRACSDIGGPEMFKVAQSDLIRGAALGGIGAAAIGAAVSGLLRAVAWAMANIPFWEGQSVTVLWIVVAVLNFAGAFASGYILRYIVGDKYANSLRIIAASLGLVFFISETFVAGALGINVQVVVLQLPGLIGFAIGAYYAMNRFKVPN